MKVTIEGTKHEHSVFNSSYPIYGDIDGIKFRSVMCWDSFNSTGEGHFKARAIEQGISLTKGQKIAIAKACHKFDRDN